MWLLNFIPGNWVETITKLVVVGSIGALGATWLLSKFPVIGNYAKMIRLVAGLSLLGSIYFMGRLDNELSWREQIAELEAKVRIAEAKSQQVNTVIQTKVVTRTKIVREKQIVVQEKIREVEKSINERCEIDPAVIEIHNRAAETPGENK